MRYQIFASWKNGKAYPLENKTSIEQWAWHFLRRNPEYQNDYDKLVRHSSKDPRLNETRNHPRSLNEALSFFVSNLVGRDGPELKDDLSHFVLHPPALPNETFDQYRARMARQGVKEISVESALSDRLRRYGIWKMVAPESENPPRFNRPKGPFRDFFRGGDSITRTLLETEAAALFDLSRSLDEQFKWVRQILEREKRKLAKRGKVSVHRIRAPKYLEYLRLLDAEASGAKPRQIAEELFPSKMEKYPELAIKNVRDGLKVGKQLRDGGYLHILNDRWGKPPKIADDN